MKLWLFAIGLLTSIPAFAQHLHENPSHDPLAQTQQPQAPYAGMQSRAIKALSEQQTADLRAGKGMSLALAAELNGYPGPSHTLEFSSQLGLTAAQKQQTQKLFEQMQVEAQALGGELLSREFELDRLFKDKTAGLASVQEATARAAAAQGKLRAAHLQYHLRMVDVLTPAQIAKYAQLRGYN